MEKEVLKFISRFTSRGEYEQVKTAFTQGCCFWFAFILLHRFVKGSRLMYDVVINHFATEIDGRIYDITGDVTDKYNMIPWDELSDTLLKNRIIRDCIMF